MGTNYYLHEGPPCPHCGAVKGECKHIGKSSAGWCFSLHVEPSEGISDLADWRELWSQPGATIVDEYGETIEPAEMEEIITARRWKYHDPVGYESWEEFHRLNGSEPGPNNLLRHRIGSHCVKHGAGTWDCIPGEFS